jgi:hypothetical protein
MHPRLAAVLAHLDAARTNLEAAVEAIPGALRGQKPAAGRWSVNEVTEHVAKVEQFFLGSLIANVEAARTAGMGPEVDEPAMLPEQTKTMVVDRATPRMAPDHAHPAGNVDALTSLQTIAAGHRQLKEVLASVDGLALSTVMHEHRFFGKLNVYQFVELLAGHEGRHTAQLREIAGQVQDL